MGAVDRGEEAATAEGAGEQGTPANAAVEQEAVARTGGAARAEPVAEKVEQAVSVGPVDTVELPRRETEGAREMGAGRSSSRRTAHRSQLNVSWAAAEQAVAVAVAAAGRAERAGPAAR